MAELAKRLRDNDPEGFKDWTDDEIEQAMLEKHPNVSAYKELAGEQSRIAAQNSLAARAKAPLAEETAAVEQRKSDYMSGSKVASMSAEDQASINPLERLITGIATPITAVVRPYVEAVESRAVSGGAGRGDSSAAMLNKTLGLEPQGDVAQESVLDTPEQALRKNMSGVAFPGMTAGNLQSMVDNQRAERDRITEQNRLEIGKLADTLNQQPNLSAEQRSNFFEGGMRKLNTDAWGANTAMAIAEGRRVGRQKYQETGDMNAAMEASRQHTLNFLDVLKRREKQGGLDARAASNTETYDSFINTLSDPREFGRFALQSGLPLAIAIAATPAGAALGGGVAGLAGRAAIGIYGTAASTAMLQKIYDGQVNWNEAFAEGVSEGLLSIPQVSALGALGRGSGAVGSAAGSAARIGGAAATGAAEEAIQTPFSEILQGRTPTGTQTLSGAALGGIMGAGMAPGSTRAAAAVTEPADTRPSPFDAARAEGEQLSHPDLNINLAPPGGFQVPEDTQNKPEAAKGAEDPAEKRGRGIGRSIGEAVRGGIDYAREHAYEIGATALGGGVGGAALGAAGLPLGGIIGRYIGQRIGRAGGKAVDAERTAEAAEQNKPVAAVGADDKAVKAPTIEQALRGLFSQAAEGQRAEVPADLVARAGEPQTAAERATPAEPGVVEEAPLARFIDASLRGDAVAGTEPTQMEMFADQPGQQLGLFDQPTGDVGTTPTGPLAGLISQLQNPGVVQQPIQAGENAMGELLATARPNEWGPADQAPTVAPAPTAPAPTTTAPVSAAPAEPAAAPAPATTTKWYHKDHALTPKHEAAAEAALREGGPGFRIVQVPVEDPLPSALYGPAAGDQPVTDAFAKMQTRGDRPQPSRMVQRPSRPSNTMTVIGKVNEDGTVEVYTAYGGPLAPREPGDPSLSPEEKAESEKFWAEHALATGERPGGPGTAKEAMNLLDVIEQEASRQAKESPKRPANVEPQIPEEMARQLELAENARKKQQGREQEPGYEERKAKLKASPAYKATYDRMIADGFPDKTARAAAYKAAEKTEAEDRNKKESDDLTGALESSLINPESGFPYGSEEDKAYMADLEETRKRVEREAADKAALEAADKSEVAPTKPAPRKKNVVPFKKPEAAAAEPAAPAPQAPAAEPTTVQGFINAGRVEEAREKARAAVSNPDETVTRGDYAGMKVGDVLPGGAMILGVSGGLIDETTKPPKKPSGPLQRRRVSPEIESEREQVEKVKTGDESRAEAKSDPIGYAIDSTVNFLFDNMNRVSTKISQHFGPRTPEIEAYQGGYVKNPAITQFDDPEVSGARRPLWNKKKDNRPAEIMGQLYVNRVANLIESAEISAGSRRAGLRLLLDAADGDQGALVELAKAYKAVLQNTIAHEILHGYRDTEDSTASMQEIMNVNGKQLLDSKTAEGTTLRSEIEQYWNVGSQNIVFMDAVQSIAEEALKAVQGKGDPGAGVVSKVRPKGGGPVTDQYAKIAEGTRKAPPTEGSPFRASQATKELGRLQKEMKEGPQGSRPVKTDDYDSFIEARDKTPRAKYLSPLTPEDASNRDVYLSGDGKVGFTLSKEKDFGNLFNNGVKGAGSRAIVQGIQLGAETLDAFDGSNNDGSNGLPALYAKHGFVEVARLKFDPSQAPEGWESDPGLSKKPDVVFMRYAGGDRSTISSRVGTFPPNSPAKVVDSYDAVMEEMKKAGERSQAVVPEGSRGVDLKGLPTTVRVNGEERVYGGFKPAQDVARKYTEKTGRKYNPPKEYVKVDADRAKRIADAYEKMKDAPDDPDVKAAHEAMIRETLDQYDAILETGLVVEFIKPGEDPYPNPRMAIDDVVQNNHLWVFPTEAGFGTRESFDASKHPMLTPTTYKISGKVATANDIFRIVHDYFGHIKDGVGFRADGEENAWRSHSSMYSPLARRAMTVATRGQNSWVNYGPYGEKNRTAKTEDTVFADQKTGLLPDWVMTEGAADPTAPEPQKPKGGKFAGMVSPDSFGSIDAWREHVRNLGFTEEQIASAESAAAPSGGLLFRKRSGAPVDTVAIRQAEPAKRNSASIEDVQKKLKNKDISSLPVDKQVDLMVEQGLKEIEYQRQQIRSGEKWYKLDIDAMEAALKRVESALKDPAQMGIFKLIAAATSFGNKPNPNVEMALQIYRGLRERGELPVMQDTGKHWAGSPTFDVTAEKIDKMVKDFGGLNEMIEWMKQEHPVSELKKYNKHGVAGKANAMVLGSEVLGPKGSAFFQNLIGNHSKTTADMWFSRTFNRWRGTEFKDAPRNTSEFKLMQRVNEEIAKRLGLDPADTQAMLWFHEKALYGRLGAKEDFGSYAVAGRRAAESLRERQRQGISDLTAVSPVKPRQESLAFEVKFGTDSPYGKKYDWKSLTPEQARKVTDEHGKNMIDAVEAETGVRILSSEPSTGVYEGEANPNWTVRLQGTPEQIEAATNLFALGSQQDSVIAARAVSSGGKPGVQVIKVNRPGKAGKGQLGLFGAQAPQDWAAPGFLEKVWDEYAKIAPGIAKGGGASLDFADGSVRIQLYGDEIGKNPKAAAEAMKKAMAAVDPGSSVSVGNKNFETYYAGNKWSDSPAGESYRESLIERGYTEEAIDQFVKAMDKSIANAWHRPVSGGLLLRTRGGPGSVRTSTRDALESLESAKKPRKAVRGVLEHLVDTKPRIAPPAKPKAPLEGMIKG